MISTSTFTSVSVEDGLDFILSHFEGPHFPRRISTCLTEKNPPWQVLVYSMDEAIKMFKKSNLLNCRVSAYRYPIPTVRGINAQVPNFFMSDLDRKDFKTDKSLQQCLQDTLNNFRNKLHGANPTVLWSGYGYHILQPLDADVILEMESVFANFHEPSRGLMRYAEKLMTDNKADSVHSNTVSFSNCMVRIPRSYNAKYVRFNDKGEILEISPQSEVKIVQRTDGYKPNIRWLLRDYQIYLIQERNNEILANLHKDQKRLRSQWRRGIEPSQYQQQTSRKYCIWKIFIPYFINIKGLTQSEAFNLVKVWLDRCGLLKRLNFNAKDNIDYALKTVRRYRPVPLNKLKVERPLLYTLLKNKRIIN
jgi:hypothetical protein